MPASTELQATLNALLSRAEEIHLELTKLSEKVELDPTIDKDFVIQACHALRAEMIRIRKRITEITSFFEGPAEAIEDFATSPTVETTASAVDDGIKSN